MKDFYRGDYPLSAWGRIKRDMRILEYFKKEHMDDEARKLQAHIKKDLVSFKKVYGKEGTY